jgi:hypothetical protein
MSFDTQERIFAFPLATLGQIGQLVADYGASLPVCPLRPNRGTIRCIAGGLDREGSTDLRALSHPTTASTTPLTDGRHAYSARWTLSILDAVQSGNVLGDEITPEQFDALRYQSDPL